jgi:hypothetical protein
MRGLSGEQVDYGEHSPYPVAMIPFIKFILDIIAATQNLNNILGFR